MKLLIKFPTRQRPEKFLSVLNTYLDFLHDKDNYEVVITADLDDPTMNNDAMRATIDGLKNTRIFYGNSKTKIEAVNADMDKCTNYDVLLLASDDMIPEVRGYDEVIRKGMREHFPDTDGILFFNDGAWGQKLNTLSIMGKKYYDRFGYIYHPDYTSFYCDNEYTDVANKLGKVQYFSQVIIRHKHYVIARFKADDLYRRNGRFSGTDAKVYAARKQLNFELDKVR